MNIYLLLILVIVLGSYVFQLLVDFLNLKNISETLPAEFAGMYPPEKYQQAQAYLRDNTLFAFVQQTFDVLLMLTVILSGFLNYVDLVARGFKLGAIPTGLIFFLLIMLLMQLVHLPFVIFDTFYLEKKYGFNKTTAKTFVLDIIKGLVLTVIFGGVVGAAILFVFAKLGNLAWLYAWLFLAGFQLILTVLAPILIMPLFNKFIPLEDGELNAAIQQYAKANKFALSGVFKMDGSKRSTKSNAFFTGIGKFRRIVLFDTLIEKHTTEELVSVLAHEIGHFKKKHIVKLMAFSILSTGLMFFVLSLFLNNPQIFAAFKVQNLSIYMSFLLFGFIYAPVELVLGVITNMFSRKYEYQADKFAVSTYKKPEVFIMALKKLSVDNLSNLTPHPLKVFLEYSHPTVLQRIDAIRK